MPTIVSGRQTSLQLGGEGRPTAEVDGHVRAGEGISFEKRAGNRIVRRRDKPKPIYCRPIDPKSVPTHIYIVAECSPKHREQQRSTTVEDRHFDDGPPAQDLATDCRVGDQPEVDASLPFNGDRFEVNNPDLKRLSFMMSEGMQSDLFKSLTSAGRSAMEGSNLPVSATGVWKAARKEVFHRRE